MADISPAILDGSSVNTKGLLVKPENGTWPLNASLDAWLFFISTPVITSGAAVAGLYLFQQSPFSSDVSKRTTISTFAIGAHLLWIFISIWGGFGVKVVGRSILEIPKGPAVALGVYHLSIGAVAYVYSRRLVPCWSKSFFNDVDPYLKNQWRFAQFFISGAFVGIVGAAIPFTLNLAGRFGLPVLVIVFGLITSPPLFIALFLMMRLHYIEVARR
ncbi:hypothetical protein [Haloarcula pellucida]|uniref:hypothetical protein n=1 Tax=Haloarcula pellucida TaxID=1427151 RepID=UPI00166E62A2|nr:hypothetical protein [Halomicroarcula pellucida]MBX0348230.1 hypothetical protein [Halomicroarcula pellucida]